jgi:hypothetical protein
MTIGFTVLTPDGKVASAYCAARSLLSVLQSSCGGNVQAIEMTPTLTMWVNEDGKLYRSEWNECATAIWHALYGPTDTVFGTVVFTGVPDENGETQSITEADLIRVERVAQAYRAEILAGRGKGVPVRS